MGSLGWDPEEDAVGGGARDNCLVFRVSLEMDKGDTIYNNSDQFRALRSLRS